MARMSKRERHGKRVSLRLPDGGTRGMFLLGEDFDMLRSVAGGGRAIKGAEKLFGEYVVMGLVRLKPEQDKNGFPYFVALLTPDGAQALTQQNEPATAAA